MPPPPVSDLVVPTLRRDVSREDEHRFLRPWAPKPRDRKLLWHLSVRDRHAVAGGREKRIGTRGHIVARDEELLLGEDIGQSVRCMPPCVDGSDAERSEGEDGTRLDDLGDAWVAGPALSPLGASPWWSAARVAEPSCCLPPQLREAG